MLLSELKWEPLPGVHSDQWDRAIIPGSVWIYRATDNHYQGWRGIYQIGMNQSPFRTPPPGQNWDELTTQCWLIEYMRWWNDNHPGG